MVQRRLQLLAQDAVLGEVVIVGTEELMMAQQEQTTARLGAALVDVIRLGSVEKTEPAEQKEVTGCRPELVRPRRGDRRPGAAR
jgi:hypothetical protein